MKNLNNNTSNYFNIIMTLSMIGIVLLNLPSISATFTTFSHISALLCLLYIYWVATITYQDQSVLKWTGFTRLAVTSAWVIFGLTEALIIILSATAFAYLYARFRKDKYNPHLDLQSYLRLIGNNGSSILSIHFVYLLLGGGFPQIINSAAYVDISALLIAVGVGSLVSLILIITAQNLDITTIIKDTDKYLIPEILALFIGITLPFIFLQISLLLFVVSSILISIQIFRSAKVNQSEEALKQRLHEMSVLNHLGATITSRLSVERSIEAVYQELNGLIDANTIYIALFDDEQQTLDFQLVMSNGKKQTWGKRELKDALIAYTINEKRSICVSREEARHLLKNLFDDELLEAEQYMIAPLSVNAKLFGVLGATNSSSPIAFSEHDFALFQTICNQTSLAIRNAMLYDKTVRLADNLSVINQSLQDVMFNLDRANSLKTACEIASNLIKTSKAAIFLLEPSLNNQLKRVDSVGFDDIDYVDTIPYKPAVFGKGARIINDVNKATSKDIKAQAKAGEFLACIQIPLRSGNSIIGTLEVYHDTPYYYENSEINLLEMLTNQITAALDNADLLQALELYATEQAQLVHLSRIAGGTLNLEKIVYDVCEILAQIMFVERVEIGLWHADRKVLRLLSPDDIEPQLKTADIDIDSISEIKQIIETEKLATLLVFNQNGTCSEGLQRYMALNQDATLAIMPMHIEGDILGVIILGNSDIREFNDNDHRLFEMANHQITVQIHNARVHTQTQQELILGLEQLGLIEDITQQISQALELDIIIQNVLDAALQSTQADFVSISLPDDSSPTLFNMIWREVVDDKVVPNSIMYNLSSGVVGHVMKTGTAMLVPDNREFADYIHPEGLSKAYLSSLAIPLISRDIVIGVINLESVHVNFFTQAQVDFIRSLAGHAAISITNATLLNARESQINVLTGLRGLSLDALRLIDPDDVYEAILHTSLILLRASEAAIFRYDIVSNKLHILHNLRIEHDVVETFASVIPDDLIQKVRNNNVIEIIEDIHLPKYHTLFENLDTPSYKSLIVIPIVRRMMVQEVLCIGFPELRKFSLDDWNIIDLLSVQVASHLENTVLNTEITTSNDRMRAILDSTRDGIILLDNKQRIRDANIAASDLTGVNLQAHLSMVLSHVAHLAEHSEQNAEVWQKIIKRYEKSPEAIHNQEYSFEHDSNLTHVRMLVTEVKGKDNQSVGHLLVLRDITEEKKLKDFRETMQSMVLHDLRGPLTAIVTSMYVAENILELYDGSAFKDLEESLKKTFNVSLKSAEDMLRQVDTLRDLPMMNQMTVDPQPISGYDIAKSAFESLSSNFIESNITVTLDIDEHEILFVDESLVRRVIVNLMHNAYKFTPLGGHVIIRMIQDSEQDNYYCIQIADNGPGIPNDQRERIFGQFIQIEGQKPRTGGKGTGLGLNFCKLAIEAHGGRIWVEADSPLSGACFAFSVPKTDWHN